jgi:2-keto-3-deoxy-6-phosphogluconate aldolase
MNYGKAIAQVVATVLSAVLAAMVVDNVVSASEWVNVAVLGVGALGVFAAPNVPGAAFTKSILAAASAALVVLTSAITDGVQATEWLQMAVAALGALGVYAWRQPAGVAHPTAST